MRVFASLLLIGLAGAHTLGNACPRGALCIAADADLVRMEVPLSAPQKPAAPLRVRVRAPADPLPSLRFDSAPVRSSDDHEMPWIWAALRARVYEQLPSQRSESFTLMLSPVVVKGQYDTIPGVGIAGDF